MNLPPVDSAGGDPVGLNLRLLIDTADDAREGRMGTKLGHIVPMGQIWDFITSVSVHFGTPSQNVLKLILKSHRYYVH